MPAAEEDHNLFGDDDEDDDEVDSEDENEADQADPKPPKRKSDAIENLNSPSPSISSSSDENPRNPNPNPSLAVPISASASASAPPNPPPSSSSPDHKRQKTATIEDSRRLFQRLWTDEDEIGLLQGFLEYTSQRHTGRRGAFSHDTAPFYDQIKVRLQLDFNKNQLVEKLRRLKKKYRNAINRMGSGKDFSFKSPHDQTTFEISRKIWSTAASVAVDDDEDGYNHSNAAAEKKVPRSRRQSQKRLDDAAAAAVEDNVPEFPHLTTSSEAAASAIPNVIEDTVRSCLSPLFKELLYCAINGPCNSALGGVALNPLPLNSLPMNFGGNLVNLSSSEAMDERWRKQQILELEVYSKRLELVQEQIKTALEELRSMGS